MDWYIRVVQHSSKAAVTMPDASFAGSLPSWNSENFNGDSDSWRCFCRFFNLFMVHAALPKSVTIHRIGGASIDNTYFVHQWVLWDLLWWRNFPPSWSVFFFYIRSGWSIFVLEFVQSFDCPWFVVYINSILLFINWFKLILLVHDAVNGGVVVAPPTYMRLFLNLWSLLLTKMTGQ